MGAARRLTMTGSGATDQPPSQRTPSLEELEMGDIMRFGVQTATHGTRNGKSQEPSQAT
jgi:hypothetical protein